SRTGARTSPRSRPEAHDAVGPSEGPPPGGPSHSGGPLDQCDRLPPRWSTVDAIQASADYVSMRYEYVFPAQTSLFRNEFSARTMFVPPSRSGPPESPKHEPL